MKGWRAACLSLILLGIPAAGRAEFDQCRLIDQVLNRLANAMAIKFDHCGRQGQHGCRCGE